MGLNMCLLELKHMPTGSKQHMEPAPSTGSPPKMEYWQMGKIWLIEYVHKKGYAMHNGKDRLCSVLDYRDCLGP